MADIAPKDSSVYQKVRDAAAEAGVGPAFQDMCMLLKAPPNLNSCILVVRNIRYMLSVLPNGFRFGEDKFPGWAEMTDWIWNNQDALTKLAGDTLALDAHTKGKSETVIIPHPMQGFGLTRYPIYSALCNSGKSTDHIEDYARLQAQFIVARRDELIRGKKHNQQPYIELYEAYAGQGDFAKEVREPDAAARAIRGLSDRAQGQVLTAADNTPEVFVETLLKIGEIVPQTSVLKQWIDNIRNYCGLLTSARGGQTRTSGDRYGGGPGVYGYVEYNDSRFGIEFTPEDEDDDEELDCSQELIFEHFLSQESAQDQDTHRDEFVHEPGLVLQGDSRKRSGTSPGKIGTARTNVAALEIDKDRLPWSAIHLRPQEVEQSLLKTLWRTARGLNPNADRDYLTLETCALIAVCLETGRPLQEAMKIRVGTVKDHGDLLFIRHRNMDTPSDWSWRALEPDYLKKHTPVKELEVERVSHLRYPVHPAADHLLRRWHDYQKRKDPSQPLLFVKEQQEYERRIKNCLGDRTGRLTLSKIRQLKWSLLSQACGGDLAEASLVMGLQHSLAHVPLFYSLLSTDEARELFAKATSSLWQDRWERWNKVYASKGWNGFR